jgi:hypothetical protein
MELNLHEQHRNKFLLIVLLLVSVFIGLDADWFSGMERRQFTVELFGIWRSEGSQDTSTSDMEARRTDV